MQQSDQALRVCWSSLGSGPQQFPAVLTLSLPQTTHKVVSFPPLTRDWSGARSGERRGTEGTGRRPGQWLALTPISAVHSEPRPAADSIVSVAATLPPLVTHLAPSRLPAPASYSSLCFIPFVPFPHRPFMFVFTSVVSHLIHLFPFLCMYSFSCLPPSRFLALYICFSLLLASSSSLSVYSLSSTLSPYSPFLSCLVGPFICFLAPFHPSLPSGAALPSRSFLPSRYSSSHVPSPATFFPFFHSSASHPP